MTIFVTYRSLLAICKSAHIEMCQISTSRMPIKPLKIKIDLQSKPLASSQDQQLIRALFGESLKIDRVNIDVY